MTRTWKIILFSAIGLVVLCCGGGIAGIFFVVSGATKAPKAATGDFLSALEAGRTQAAYDLLCASAQQAYGPERFEAYVKKDPVTAHDLDWGGSYNNSNGHETADIGASVTYQKAGKSSHTFSLVKEGGAWKVCGDPY